MNELALGLSPCPNDTFIFHALLQGLVQTGFAVTPVFADVQKLNELAIAGELPFTKISVGVVPDILDKYGLLSSGAALGWGCGPLVVARDSNVNRSAAKIAIPGRHTTASLLLDLHGGFNGRREEMCFSDIMPAVASGRVDLGVIIHEGRFTYGEHGLVKILDLGQWWEDQYHMPLPLGAIAFRRDVDPALALSMQEAITASIDYARKHPEASKDFVREHAQELDEKVTCAHIKTFVTDYSSNLGQQGRQAISWLVQSALARQGKNANADLFLKQISRIKA